MVHDGGSGARRERISCNDVTVTIPGNAPMRDLARAYGDIYLYVTLLRYICIYIDVSKISRLAAAAGGEFALENASEQAKTAPRGAPSIGQLHARRGGPLGATSHWSRELDQIGELPRARPGSGGVSGYVLWLRSALIPAISTVLVAPHPSSTRRNTRNGLARGAQPITRDKACYHVQSAIGPNCDQSRTVSMQIGNPPAGQAPPPVAGAPIYPQNVVTG
jgi:hypothetical protein